MIKGQLYYDREGGPIDSTTMDKLFKDGDYKILRKDTLLESMKLSTVWLGLDHSFTPGASPLIFETMIFGGPFEYEPQWRWTTEAEALDGHEKIKGIIESPRVRSGGSRFLIQVVNEIQP